MRPPPWRLIFFASCAMVSRSAEPTAANVHYGPYERNVLDFYQAKSPRPSPVVIYFHGGSFKGGDKGSFGPRAGEFLEAGIAVVSANYRFSRHAPYPGPMLDGARVVQFVRSKASEWRIDPGKVALSGGSAGATMALWIALHDELADAASSDPVARISTRVTCAATRNGPTFLDPEMIRKEFGATELGAMLELFGVKTHEELLTIEMKERTLDASPVHHATKDDPPLLLIHGGDLTPTPLASAEKLGLWIHHPRFGEMLKERYDRLGIECRFYHRGKPAPKGEEVAFLLKCFGVDTPIRTLPPEASTHRHSGTLLRLTEYSVRHILDLDSVVSMP